MIVIEFSKNFKIQQRFGNFFFCSTQNSKNSNDYTIDTSIHSNVYLFFSHSFISFGVHAKVNIYPTTNNKSSGQWSSAGKDFHSKERNRNFDWITIKVLNEIWGWYKRFIWKKSRSSSSSLKYQINVKVQNNHHHQWV